MLNPIIFDSKQPKERTNACPFCYRTPSAHAMQTDGEEKKEERKRNQIYMYNIAHHESVLPTFASIDGETVYVYSISKHIASNRARKSAPCS